MGNEIEEVRFATLLKEKRENDEDAEKKKKERGSKREKENDEGSEKKKKEKRNQREKENDEDAEKKKEKRNSREKENDEHAEKKKEKRKQSKVDFELSQMAQTATPSTASSIPVIEVPVIETRTQQPSSVLSFPPKQEPCSVLSFPPKQEEQFQGSLRKPKCVDATVNTNISFGDELGYTGLLDLVSLLTYKDPSLIESLRRSGSDVTLEVILERLDEQSEEIKRNEEESNRRYTETCVLLVVFRKYCVL